MAAYFFDSSALVKRYAREQGTAWVVSLFRQANANRLYVARIAGVETMAALARKQRGGFLTTDAQARALTRLRREFMLRFRVVEITPSLLADAETLAGRHFLRGYDAVQLAAALQANAERISSGVAPLTFVTADKDLISAAPLESLLADNPELH